MVRSAGIDIGSRTVKAIIVDDGKIAFEHKTINSYDPIKVCVEILGNVQYDIITATGYGRHTFRNYFPSEIISEISAFARGAKSLFENCHTILDIGGQDTKVISLDDKGKVRKFEMNDRCAAGTGRFLEIMASTLGFSLDDFAKAAISAEKAVKINSMCTVFAESELISLTAKGASRESLALGIHESIALRSISMLQRVSIEDDVVFAGGVALNPCMKNIIEHHTGRKLCIPDDPQLVGALGCALLGAQNFSQAGNLPV